MYITDHPEKILCAAIWYKDLDKMSEKWVPAIEGFMRPSNVTKGIVISGYRHPSCMYLMCAITGLRSIILECGEYIQGFLTSHNRFVNRKEAMIIAKEQNQIISDTTSDILYSEDLY